MSFARRKARIWSDTLRNWLWPQMGLRRLARLYARRLERLPESATRVAAGFGLGLAIGITPLVGAHTILSVIVARLTRTSMVAALIATLLVNPWTAAPIWIATYYAGRWIEGASPGENPPGFVAMFRGLTQAVWSLDVRLFAEDVWPIFRPMLIGSVPLGIAAGVAGFALLRPALARMRGAKVRRQGH
jgi:uncharacterized protein (DUF2062 family)